MLEAEMITKECRAPGVTTRKDGDGYVEWPYCSASNCAMWESWEFTQAKIFRDDAEKSDDWVEDKAYEPRNDLVQSRRYTRQQRVGEGDCGLKTKELECSN